VRVPADRGALPLAIAAFADEARVAGPAGRYRFCATLEQGAPPLACQRSEWRSAPVCPGREPRWPGVDRGMARDRGRPGPNRGWGRGMDSAPAVTVSWASTCQPAAPRHRHLSRTGAIGLPPPRRTRGDRLPAHALLRTGGCC
jgi:hypothetical protein